jgi:hypothetical protein
MTEWRIQLNTCVGTHMYLMMAVQAENKRCI